MAPLLAGVGVADLVVFALAGAVVLGGALGVILSRNPVHAALSLVVTLFGIAVLFVSQQAHFLAVVQVIVYAGAIVVLFLFVIMLLGVDRQEALGAEPLPAQRPLALGLGALSLLEVLLLVRLRFGDTAAVNLTHQLGAVPLTGRPDVNQLAEVIFSRYLFPFEVTSVLLVIAVVGAVVLARRPQLEDEEVGG